MLVLGAGAGRLAYDLHQALKPPLTVALDFNPLFLLAASRILAGPPLELYEFPIAPRSIADHAVLRRHEAPAPPAAGFELVLADASSPPFLPGRFDLVLTPVVHRCRRRARRATAAPDQRDARSRADSG